MICVMTSARAGAWAVAISIPAGPLIGIPAFALFAVVVPSLAWPGGLIVLLGAPAVCCYWIGRRLGSGGAANAAAIVAAVSSLVTAVALVAYALSNVSFG
jgi:hypothetical protein